MRAKTPLVLALLAGLLAAYILLVERHHATTGGARAAAERLWPELARRQITEIRIDRRDRSGQEEHFAVGRPEVAGAGAAGPPAGEAWRLSPGGRPTAPGAVDDLLDVIDGLEIDRVTDAPAAVNGLEPPAVTVTITAAGRRFGLRLGKTDAAGRGVFATRDGDARVLVIGRRLRDLLDRPATAFRDGRLFPSDLAGRAASVSWASASEAQRTLRNRGGIWSNEKGLFVSPPAVAQALRDLGELKAAAFPSPPSLAPSAPPGGSLDVLAASSAIGAATAGRQQVRLWRGAGCAGDGWLAESTADDQAAPAWLCLGGAEVETIWRALALAHQRQQRLLSGDVEQITGVQVSASGQPTLHLRRERGDWHIAEPTVSYAADGDVITAWLGRLAAMSIDAQPPAVSSAPADVRRLLIEGPEGEPVRAIDVAAPRGARARVQREGETAPALAPAALHAELDPQPLRFRSRSVLSLALYDVERVEITSSAGRVEVRKGPGEIWQATTPGAQIDSAALDGLLSTITNLQAVRFPKSPPPFTPERTIEVTLRDNRQKLELSRPTANGVCLARIAGNTIFEISPTDHSAFSQSIVKKAP